MKATADFQKQLLAVRKQLIGFNLSFRRYCFLTYFYLHVSNVAWLLSWYVLANVPVELLFMTYLSHLRTASFELSLDI